MTSPASHVFGPSRRDRAPGIRARCGLRRPALVAGLSVVAIGRALAQDPVGVEVQAVTLDEL
ncbi:MAG: hypothetical protein K0Q54_114 [Methylobacterium brachiatum]|jgi:hypothetical protein|nr:hypothetical protein [Methylobacterium brachiatum]